MARNETANNRHFPLDSSQKLAFLPTLIILEIAAPLAAFSEIDTRDEEELNNDQAIWIHGALGCG